MESLFFIRSLVASDNPNLYLLLIVKDFTGAISFKASSMFLVNFLVDVDVGMSPDLLCMGSRDDVTIFSCSVNDISVLMLW